MNVYIGFDSAWTGNTSGAAALIKEDDLGLQFTPPWAQDFGTAAMCFKQYSQAANLSVIAIDQPTIVTNPTGCRPVERVARRVVGRLGGAVQPANTGNKPMFGPEAPIWKFREQLNFTQKPTVLRPQAGQYLVEVYPCLNIVGLFTYFYKRQHRRYIHRFGEVARYNPTRATFQIGDWEALCECISQYGETHQINGLSICAEEHASVRNAGSAKPSKCHQDALDAVLCTIMAYTWAKGTPVGHGIAIGDTAKGYMVTVAHDHGLANELKAAADDERVAFSNLW